MTHAPIGLCLSFLALSSGCVHATKCGVTVEKRERHYVVNIEESTPEETGRQYAEALKGLPWAEHMDAQVSEIVKITAQLPSDNYPCASVTTTPGRLG